MRKKYLRDFLINAEFGSNNVILAPTGAGKTYYILNDLIPQKNYQNVLYLCDTTNLRYQTINDSSILDNITILCYHTFGVKVKRDNFFLKQFDCVICDEFHNLINYERLFTDTALSHAIKELIKHYDNIDIYYFTATPQELFKEKYHYDLFDRNMIVYDFLESNEIMRYETLGLRGLSSYKSIGKNLKKLKPTIDKNNEKVLIFLDTIDKMTTVEDELREMGFSPICLWSRNNTDRPMSDEQLAELKLLLANAKLSDCYNVLIINRSSETGINIKDKAFQYCFVCSSDETIRIQVRGRLRHDIKVLYTVTPAKPNKKFSEEEKSNMDEIINKYLNRKLLKEDKDKLCEQIDMHDSKGRLIGWTRIKKMLITVGYTVTDNRTKKISYSIISK